MVVFADSCRRVHFDLCDLRNVTCCIAFFGKEAGTFWPGVLRHASSSCEILVQGSSEWAKILVFAGKHSAGWHPSHSIPAQNWSAQSQDDKTYLA